VARPKAGAMPAQALPCDDTTPHLHIALAAEQWRSAVEVELEATEQRHTSQRRRVLDRIAAQATPFTAESLVAQLRSAGDRAATVLGRATIYRTLEWLRKSGWIARLHRDGDANVYTRLLPGHHHSVVCTRCGAVFILGGCLVEPLVDALLAETNFHVQGHVLEVYGVCASCHSAAMRSG